MTLCSLLLELCENRFQLFSERVFAQIEKFALVEEDPAAHTVQACSWTRSVEIDDGSMSGERSAGSADRPFALPEGRPVAPMSR